MKETIASCGSNWDAGMEAFCSQNDGDGWMLPETLCLAELGLGHDERAKKPEPVRSRLGDRFLPWQPEQSVEDSWKECELHARNILGEKEFARLKAELAGKKAPAGEDLPLAAERPAAAYETSTPGAQGRLFPGDPPLFDDGIVDPLRRKKRKT